MNENEVAVQQRIRAPVDGDYLKQRGKIDKRDALRRSLESKMKDRPSMAALEQRAIVPHGAFEMVDGSGDGQTALSVDVEVNGQTTNSVSDPVDEATSALQSTNLLEP